jgi:DNA primase large subunit
MFKLEITASAELLEVLKELASAIKGHGQIEKIPFPDSLEEVKPREQVKKNGKAGLTREQVRKLVSEKSEEHMGEIKALLKTFGVKSVTEMEEKDFESFTESLAKI